MSVEKLPVFCLEHKYFDKLHTSSQIAIYAHISRLVEAGLAFTAGTIREWGLDRGITEIECNDALEKLISIGFLKVSK